MEKNYWTKKHCDEVIEENKDWTNYFKGNLYFEDMYEMFRYQLNFGEAETAVILASLMKAGAKFQRKEN